MDGWKRVVCWVMYKVFKEEDVGQMIIYSC